MRATPNKCQHVIYLTECPCQRSPKSCPLENHAGNYLCSLLVPLAYSWTQQDTHQLRYRAVATHTPLQTHQNKTNTHIDMTYRPSSDQTGNSASRPLASPLLCLGQNTPGHCGPSVPASNPQCFTCQRTSPRRPNASEEWPDFCAPLEHSAS